MSIETLYLLTPTPALRRELVRLCRREGHRHIVPADSFAELRQLLELREAAGPVAVLLEGDPGRPDPPLPPEVSLVVLVEGDETPEAAGAGGPPYCDVLRLPLSNTEASLRIRSALTCSFLQNEKRRLEIELAGSLRSEVAGGSERDPLTGLSSETTALRALEWEWRRCLRYDWSLAVIVAVLEPAIAGPQSERLLSDLGAALRDGIHRPGDTLAYCGDGEFLAVLSETESPGARHVAGRLQDIAAERNLRSGGQRLRLRCGVAAASPKQVYRDLGTARNALAPEGAHRYLLEAAKRDLLHGHQDSH